MYEAEARTEEWKPGKALFVVIGVVAFVAIIAALFLIQGDRPPLPLQREAWFVLIALMFIWLFLMPLVQFLLLRLLAQVRPRFFWSKWKTFNSDPPVFGVWEAKRQPMTKSAFAVICVVPIVTAWLVLPLLVAISLPEGGSYLAAAGLGATMGVSIKELWYLVYINGKPRATHVEELDHGTIRFYESAPSSG